MNVIIFEEESFYQMLNKIYCYFNEKLTEDKRVRKIENTVDWISSEEAKVLLGVKSKTKMQNLRNGGEIEFAKYGRKLKYSKKSILKYIDNHKFKPF